MILCGLSVFPFALASAQDAAPPPLVADEEEEAPPAPLLPGAQPEAAASAAPVLPGGPAGGPVVPNFFGGDGALAPEPGLEGGDDFAFEKSEDEINQEVRVQAFDLAIEGILPLRPNEIRTLLERFDRMQESVELPVYPAPKPQVAVETVSLDPGSAPVVVSVSYGHVTTLTILDMTGAPWPIEDISWAGNFEIIETNSGQGSHLVRISPQSEFASGNMSIRLLTLKTPVIISLETSRDIVHYRFDAIIPEYGPMAETPLIEKGITTVAGDTNIAGVLQGVLPGGAKKLDVSGVDSRTTAYSFNGLTYVRTPLTLLSPAWSSSVASADGMRVYSIKEAPVLLLSDKGKMVRARLSMREDVLKDIVHGR